MFKLVCSLHRLVLFMYHVDVAWKSSSQSPTKKSPFPIICPCEIQCSSVISDLQFYKLVSSLSQKYCLILWYLLESGLWPSFQSPQMPRATKNSAQVMDTCVNQETSMISQDSLCSDQEMEVQSPQCFPPSTSQAQSFVQPIFMPYIKGPKMG